MKLASVEVIPYALPFRRPYVTARGRLDRREMVLLRLRSEDGLVGLGEAVPLSLRGGAALVEVVRELEALTGLPHGDVGGLRASAIALTAPARCAVETALLDLGARAGATAPLRSPFGSHSDTNSERCGGAIRCNATLVAGEPATVAEEALRWAAEGFETFKLKLGAGDDDGQVRAVREALGPAARIRVDANAAWDVETAIEILGELGPFEVELAEQPVATLEEMATVAATTAIPLAADESVESRGDAERAVAASACRYTGVKLSKVGGPEEAMAISAALPAYVSSALDGPVGIAAGAAVAAAVDAAGGPGLAHGLATQLLFAETVATAECELRDGMLHPPAGPGLGVEIDEDALAAHRLD